MKKKYPQPIAPILSGIVERYGLQTNLQVENLKKNWEQIAGPQLAEHTLPISLRFRKLTLLVDSPSWTQQINFIRPGLLDQIKAFQKNLDVAEIGFRIGPLPEKKPAMDKETPGSTFLSEDEFNFIQESLKPIQDPKIQESFRRVMVRALLAKGPTHP
ncbi:MAG TPA: DUF721 domain-containing protein [Nitrospiria bacterium]|jgi:hypothetical protein